jgi:hypothetical protein
VQISLTRYSKNHGQHLTQRRARIHFVVGGLPQEGLNGANVLKHLVTLALLLPIRVVRSESQPVQENSGRCAEQNDVIEEGVELNLAFGAAADEEDTFIVFVLRQKAFNQLLPPNPSSIGGALRPPSVVDVDRAVTERG